MATTDSNGLPADVEKYAEKILQVCSYHRRDFDLVVVRSRPHHMQLVQSCLQSAFETSPIAELGILGRLPVEIMSMILRWLDVLSFFRFRQVNRRARVQSTGLWEYQLVSKHGLEGFRGLLRAEIAHYFTLHDLYWALLSDKCSECGDFGGLLFLFTLERTCFNCLQYSPNYVVLALSTFGKLARVSPACINGISGSTLRTVPGIYNMMETPAKRPKNLVYVRRVTDVLTEQKANDVRKFLDARFRKEPPGYRFMAATAYPFYNLETAQLERGVSCKGCQVRLEAVRYGDIRDRDRTYSPEGFLSHFSQCVESQHLWARSELGTRPVDEPVFTRQCGHFNRLGSDGMPA
jgi:hypothetical protein